MNRTILTRRLKKMGLPDDLKSERIDELCLLY